MIAGDSSFLMPKILAKF